MKNLAKAAAVGLTASVLPIVGLASPADAACTTMVQFTAISISDSSKFYANSGCDGVWGVKASHHSDPVRGRYHKDGSWRVSSYGWTFVHPGNDSDSPKIIGNTTTDRHLKGQSKTIGQGIWYKF